MRKLITLLLDDYGGDMSAEIFDGNCESIGIGIGLTVGRAITDALLNAGIIKDDD